MSNKETQKTTTTNNKESGKPATCINKNILVESEENTNTDHPVNKQGVNKENDRDQWLGKPSKK
jgi:hypothetical protein